MSVSESPSCVVPVWRNRVLKAEKGLPMFGSNRPPMPKLMMPPLVPPKVWPLTEMPERWSAARVAS